MQRIAQPSDKHVLIDCDQEMTVNFRCPLLWEDLSVSFRSPAERHCDGTVDTVFVLHIVNCARAVCKKPVFRAQTPAEVKMHVRERQCV